jgi:hypothetical protein
MPFRSLAGSSIQKNLDCSLLAMFSANKGQQENPTTREGED